jgi:hypothetical protein
MCRTGGNDPADMCSHRIDDGDDAAAIRTDRQCSGFSVSDGLKFDARSLQGKKRIFKIDAVLHDIMQALPLIPFEE